MRLFTFTIKARCSRAGSFYAFCINHLKQKERSLVRGRGTSVLYGLNTDTAVLPAKSDSDMILCLQFLSKTLTCILHLS